MESPICCLCPHQYPKMLEDIRPLPLTLSTGSVLGSESTPPSRTLSALASTHSAAQRQSYHVPSTKTAPRPFPGKAGRIPITLAWPPSL